MNKIVYFILMIVSFYNNLYAQNNEVKDDFIDRQNWFKKAINVIYEGNNTKEIKITCYFKNNELYVTCEYNLDLHSSVAYENDFEGRSVAREMIFKMASVLITNDGGLLENFEKNYRTRYINFLFSFLTKDIKNIDYKYYVEVADLYKISNYYNKKDFFEILK
ncbi:hypothetical protein [Flavobacterium geliluteum]|uniref:Uncharacterized protein n=1 Tax=Flavobacterium geliluteum TaxID=2816120 RepID=A0A940XFZ4_9FLAO|nr:hypothetical protein [Flavobacterium geliluteum]MBP4139019.1 hypothetical protein [Flavobacterium geliluteum]